MRLVEWRGESFFRFLIRHRASVLLVHLALLVTALVGANEVQVDYSAEDFLEGSGSARELSDAFSELFPKGDLQVSAFLAVDEKMGS